MNARGLRFVAPASEPARELNRLLDEREALAAKVGDAERSGRYASAERLQASDALQAIERRRATGDDVSDAEVKAAEKKLAAATAREREPWAERAGGLRAGLRDLDARVATHVAENFAALADELAADGQAAASRLDDAARELLAAYSERQGLEQRTFALASVVRNPRPGDVTRTRAEALASEAEKLLQQGGEDAPTLLTDPRQPRHGQAVAAGFSPDDVDPWSS